QALLRKRQKDIDCADPNVQVGSIPSGCEDTEHGLCMVTTFGGYERFEPPGQLISIASISRQQRDVTLYSHDVGGAAFGLSILLTSCLIALVCCFARSICFFNSALAVSLASLPVALPSASLALFTAPTPAF